MDLKRGDNKTIYLSVPISVAPEGSTLYFMAKPQPDDDFSDEAALININTTDRVINGDKAKFTLKVLPADTKQIKLNNKSVIELRGEFEIRTPSGEIYSLPQDNRYIRVKVHADIRRGGE